ncbi:hypothetical protein [Vibrio atypicus]|uniref:hypothetical protein n=1 Tax=Vibrio atypicus TaxID=558271 RepID=UPI00135B86BA|nr:hypothetical protein [Vibrio atypicus]
MPFDNDIEQMMNYLERFCKAPHIDALDNVSDEQVNLLLDFLTLAHKLSCDIYATSNLSCSHFLGIGVFATSQDRAPQGNLFVKVEADNLYLSFELEECGEESLLTPIRVIDALIYLAERTGHAHLPEDYIKQ